MRSHAYWTTGEIRLLRSLHHSGMSRVDFAAKFPRHTAAAVSFMACKIGVRRRKPEPKLATGPNPHHQWLRIAHEHFARREQGLLA